MVALDLTPLKPGTHHFSLTPEPADLDLDPEVFHEIAVEIRLDLGQERAYVQLSASASAALVCDRTLEPYRQRVSGDHAVIFLAPEQLTAENEDPDQLRPLPPPGNPLDLAEPIRDTLLLALPVRRIAPSAEDRDIPLQFGSDATEEGATDPRWDALRGLRDAS